MHGYTEADYENSVIELFRNMGYRHLYGPDVERDLRDPLYEEVLEDSLVRLNPSLPRDAINEALNKLRNIETAHLSRKIPYSWTICRTAFRYVTLLKVLSAPLLCTL